MLESARLRPVVAFSVPQSAPTNRVVDDYLIPAGTDYIIDAYALNVKNDFWGDDKESFRPERFQEPGRKTKMRYNYWRFGFGPRQCLGKYVVDVIIRTVLMEIIREYRLSLKDEKGLEDRGRESWITLPAGRVMCERIAG